MPKFTLAINIDAPCPPDIPDIRRALVQYFSTAKVTVTDAGEEIKALRYALKLHKLREDDAPCCPVCGCDDEEPVYRLVCACSEIAAAKALKETE